MTPVGAGVLGLLIWIVSFAPRRWALLGMMASILYLTQGLVVEILGVHMYALRFLEAAGVVRIFRRREFIFSRLHRLDYLLLWTFCYKLAIFVLRSSLGYGTSADISASSMVGQIGTTIDIFFGYFLFRGLIGSLAEFTWCLRAFTLLLLPYVALVAMERVTWHNPFAAMGGMPEIWIEPGRLRCYGSFMHPSLLGTLGASLLPLYIGLFFAGTARLRATLGMVSCLAIVGLSGSGGPASYAGLAIISWLLWPMRTRMAVVRRAIAAGLIIIALVMKAPLWYLPAKLGAITGGGGWHRSRLMELAFDNIDQWWFAGMPLDLTSNWFPYLVGGAADITNLYVAYGLEAGVLAMALFIALIVNAFRCLGISLKTVRGISPPSREAELILWGLGATLAGHASNWLAITYFDQTALIWLMQFATITTLAQTCRDSPPILATRGVPESYRPRHNRYSRPKRITTALSATEAVNK